MFTLEYNFDGLIGPTHHYGGLAYGNLPSMTHRFTLSHPKKAALEGLEKMRLLNRLGVKQAFLPPQERPFLEGLRQLGYQGSDRQILEKVYEDNPELLLTYSSASAMWAANAATFSSSADTADHRIHITTANLLSKAHRAIESKQTSHILKRIFSERRHFIHHPALPNDGFLFDEGAANHMRVAPAHGERGIEIFVYGMSSQANNPKPKNYPARQSLEASTTIALTHQLSDDYVMFVQQNPEVIDLGAFHNDLVAVSNENVLLYHERAFLNGQKIIEQLQSQFEQMFRCPLYVIKITEEQLSVSEALETFFFNSQIVSLPDGKMALIAPVECYQEKTRELIDQIIENDNPIDQAHFISLKESMENGGGPGCLRIRVILTEEEAAIIHQGFVLNEIRLCLLEDWIKNCYRDELRMEDLKDYQFYLSNQKALDELTQILNLGSIYSFQKE